MSPVAPKAIVIYSGLDPLTLVVKLASPVSPPVIAVLMVPYMQAVIKEMAVWTVFLDFWILGGGLQLRPRVFTVLIYPALFDQMLRAAKVVLNKCRPKETLPIIVALSHLGCMYLESQRRHHRFTGRLLGLEDWVLYIDSIDLRKGCLFFSLAYLSNPPEDV